MASDPAPSPAASGACRLAEQILESIQESVIAVGLDHRVLAWSRGAEALFGWSAEEAVGRTLPELIRPDIHPDAFDRFLRRVVAEGRAQETGPRRRKDGSPLIIEATFAVVRDEDGSPRCVVGVSRDVTALTAEREQQLDQARLRGLESRMNDVELVVRLDGRLVHANDRAVRAYGYPLDALLGLDIRELRAQETVEDVAAQMEQARTTGIRFETLHRRRDGSTFPVEVSSRAFEVGGEVYLHSLVRDLTHERAALAALRESEARFRRLAGAVPVMIWTADPQMRCTWANQVVLDYTGRTLEQLLGEGWIADFHPDDVREVVQKSAAALEQRMPFSREVRLRGRDGAYRWFANTAVPRWSATGVFEGYVGSCLDVSELKAASAALEESQQQLARALRGSNDGTFDWNLASGRVARNPRTAGLLGREPSALAPTPEGWLAHVHPEDAGGLRERLAAVAGGTAPELDHEYRVLHADGSVRWMRGRARRTEGADGAATVSGTISDVTDRHEAKRKLEEALRANLQLVAELRAALADVKTLSGLLPICMYCKKIRDDAGYWARIEEYLSRHSQVLFTHGMCPECAARNFPQGE